jgi:outer membrane protein assembly factor BamB
VTRGERRLRGALGWLPALLLVPAAAVAVVHVSDLDDEFVALRAVHPLDLGTTWLYQVRDHDEASGTRTSQVAGRTSLLGFGDGVVDASIVTRHYTAYPGYGVRDSTSYLGVDGRTLLQYAQLYGTTFSALDPPAPAYRLVDRGSHYSYEGLFGTDPFAFDTTLKAEEDVELGGRTFEGCAHWVNRIEVPIEGADPAEEVLEEWTCPGLGVVRSVDRIDAYDVLVTEDLLAFHGAEGNWWAEGRAPSPADPGPSVLGSTDGFDTRRSRAIEAGRLGERLAWSDVRPGTITFPPVSDGRTVVVATQDGQVSARDVALGAVAWRVAVAAPVVAAPVVAGRVVLVGDGTRRLWAFSIETGEALWVRRFDDVVSSSPTLTDAGVAITTEDARLTMLDLADGSTLWDQVLPGRPRSSPAVVGDTLLVTEPGGTLSALDTRDGTTRWSRTLEGGVEQGPAVPPTRHGPVLVSDKTGVLHAYAVDDGDEQWARGIRGAAMPLAVSDGVAVVATSTTRIVGVSLASGQQLWRRGVPVTQAAPVVVGVQSVIATRDGQVIQLDLRTGVVDRTWRLPSPQPGAELFADVEPGLVGDDLVFSANITELVGTVLWAYPALDGEGATDGVVLHPIDHPLISSPNEQPALAGADTILATGDQLVRSGPDGDTTLATSASGLQTGAVVRDGIAYVRVDDQLQALDVEDGAVEWSVPAGAALLGAQPSVSKDAVVFGSQDDGLVAVDRATGRERWSVPVPDVVSVGVPLQLPGGDVVYGGGGLTRYDGTTGRTVWQQPDTFLFGPAAEADGIVAAESLGKQSPAGVGAYDAETGAQLWFAPTAGIPSYIGPAAGDGVVVAADDAGTVTAWDAAVGTKLWELPLGHPLAGSPVIDDGRLLVVESGTGRGLKDSDYRVSVHDLHSGALLAAYEPGQMPFRSLPTPSIGTSEAGHVLMPLVGSLAEFEAVVP